jgi:hypothetical protein
MAWWPRAKRREGRITDHRLSPSYEGQEMRFGLIFFALLGGLLVLYGVLQGFGFTDLGTSGITTPQASPVPVPPTQIKPAPHLPN